MTWKDPNVFRQWILGTGRFSLGDDPRKEPSPGLQLILMTAITVGVVIGCWVGPENWGGPQEFYGVLIIVIPCQLLVMIRYGAHFLRRREILLERAKQGWKGD